MLSFNIKSVRQCSTLAQAFGLIVLLTSSRAAAFESVLGMNAPVLAVERDRFVMHYRELERDGTTRYFKRTYRRDGRPLAPRKREDPIDGEYAWDTLSLPPTTDLPPEFQNHGLDRIFQSAWLGGALVVLGSTSPSNEFWVIVFRGSGRTVPVKHLLGTPVGIVPDATGLQCDEERCLVALRTTAGVVVASLRSDSLDVFVKHTLADTSRGGYGVTLAVLGQDALVAYQLVKSRTQRDRPIGVIQVRHLSLPLRNR